jgi:hypothetical protein
LNPTCRQHLEAIYTCFVELFEKAIRQGRSDGSIAPVSARKNALLVFAMVDGVVKFNTYNLYEAGALFDELLEACRRMLQAKPKRKNRRATC